MKLLIKIFAVLLFIAIPFQLFSKPNSRSLKRSNKSKLNKEIRLDQNFNNKKFGYATQKSLPLMKKLNRLNKSNSSSEIGILDSTVYYQDENKKKYEVDFNSDGLIVFELVRIWNDITNSWNYDFRRTLEYNDEQKQLLSQIEYFDNDADEWMNDWRYVTEYQNNGSTEIWLDQEWNSATNNWESWWRQTVTYNLNTVSFLEEIWDDAISNWTNDFKADINYDENGNELNYFGEFWDTETEQWTNSWIDTTFYDNQGRAIGYKSYYWDDNQWYAWDNESYYYDDNGNLIEYLVRDIDYISGNWINFTRTTYEYDESGNLITEFLDNLDPEYFNYRTTYQYDSQGNMTYAMNESVDPTNNSTELVTGGVFFSDLYANYTFDASELNAFYSIPTSIQLVSNEIKNEFRLEQNFPNPFNPATNITYTIPNSNSGLKHVTTLKVYDLLGNEIATLVDEIQNTGTYSIEFNASNLASGNYYYQLTTGRFSQTKSMMIIK